MGIKDFIKPFGSQSFAVGIGVAAFAYFIGPQLKQALGPVVVKGTQGAVALGSKTLNVLGDSKNKVSQMISDKANASVKTVSIEGNTDFKEALLNELKAEREATNKILMELIGSISGLKEQFAQIPMNENH